MSWTAEERAPVRDRHGHPIQVGLHVLRAVGRDGEEPVAYGAAGTRTRVAVLRRCGVQPRSAQEGRDMSDDSNIERLHTEVLEVKDILGTTLRQALEKVEVAPGLTMGWLVDQLPLGEWDLALAFTTGPLVGYMKRHESPCNLCEDGDVLRRIAELIERTERPTDDGLVHRSVRISDLREILRG